MTAVAECPVGCGRNVAAGKLLCGPCWAEVPTHLQRDVYRTWRKYSAFRGITPSERRAARIAYQEARDAAIGSIR